MTIDKECEICGIGFTTDRKTTKYCPSCRNHSAYKREMLERRVAISKMKMEDEVATIENECRNCGKTFISIRYPKTMCSTKCEKEYKTRIAKCAQCGKMLAENGIEVDLSKRVHFCNAECEHQYRFEKALANGLQKTCERCGKTYMANRKEQRFCSNDCRNQHMKMQPRHKTPVFLDKYVVCAVCRKRVLVRLPKEEALNPSYRYICSENCAKIVAKYRAQNA